MKSLQFLNKGLASRVSALGMKTILVTVTIALAGAASTQAQILRPSVGSGAVVGAVAGGLIGGHNGDRWAQGAVIGAAAGALIGAALTPQEQAYRPPPVYQAPVYGQQVYGQSTYGQPVYSQSTQTVYAPAPVTTAPTVPDAPSIYDYPAPQVVYAQPQVVYVERPPQVVYVPSAPVYVRPPLVSLGIYSGPRYVSSPRYVPAPRYGPAPHYGRSSHSHGRPHYSPRDNRGHGGRR